VHIWPIDIIISIALKSVKFYWFRFRERAILFLQFKFDILNSSVSAILHLVDSASICEIVEIRHQKQESASPSVAFWPKFAAELRNQTSFSATEVRATWSSRPLGDNEPKVTTTGWCLCYCCRWLPELDGAWPRFPWFTEVPNRVSPLKTSRARWLHNESFYLHGTYEWSSREFQHFVAPATSVFHRAPSWFDKFVSKWRRPLQVTPSRKIFNSSIRSARTRKICRVLGMRETKRTSRKKECNYSLVFQKLPVWEEWYK